jgi:SHS2 domain-containing protein
VYRWIDHTAELQLAIEAPTEQGVFADALAALAELLRDAHDGSSVEREIELAGEDRAELLADWLEELVYLADVEGFMPQRLLKFDRDSDKLCATVQGRCGDPRPLVKAVTRHDLAFEQHPDDELGWRARVVLDV